MLLPAEIIFAVFLVFERFNRALATPKTLREARNSLATLYTKQVTKNEDLPTVADSQFPIKFQPEPILNLGSWI